MDQGSVLYKRYCSEQKGSRSPRKMENVNEGSTRATLFGGKMDRTTQLVREPAGAAVGKTRAYKYVSLITVGKFTPSRRGTFLHGDVRFLPLYWDWEHEWHKQVCHRSSDCLNYGHYGTNHAAQALRYVPSCTAMLNFILMGFCIHTFSLKSSAIY